MKLYNSPTRSIAEFAPQGDAVTIYVCGITPYDTTHLGHLFTYAAFDVLIRYLEFNGHNVRYVQNVTDIDDDILRRAGQTGEDWWSLGNRWTAHFMRDLQALHVRPPDHYPRATDVINEIIAVIQRLLAAGVAYQANGNVYFEVACWPEFGQLSQLSYDEMLPVANERGNNPDDPHKRDPLDFVLWQAQAPGEPAWDSPWGAGRPGWHIECSVMSTSLLGNTIDIHGGGADLLFPHHESEIAQSETATGVKPFVRLWMHTAMVRHKGEKMSKSLGNLVMARDLLDEGWSPIALRLYLAAHHYRQPWSHDPAALARAAEQAALLEAAVRAEGGSGPELPTQALEDAFSEAMDDDLNSPAAIKILLTLAAQIVQAGRAGQDVRRALWKLRTRCLIFGLCPDHVAEERVVVGWDHHLRRFQAG